MRGRARAAAPRPETSIATRDHRAERASGKKPEGLFEIEHQKQRLTSREIASVYAGAYEYSLRFPIVEPRPILHICAMEESRKSANLISVSQLAEALCVSEKTIRRLASRERIPYYRIAKTIRFSYEEVLAALRPQNPLNQLRSRARGSSAHRLSTSGAVESADALFRLIRNRQRSKI